MNGEVSCEATALPLESSSWLSLTRWQEGPSFPGLHGHTTALAEGVWEGSWRLAGPVCSWLFSMNLGKAKGKVLGKNAASTFPLNICLTKNVWEKNGKL